MHNDIKKHIANCVYQAIQNVYKIEITDDIVFGTPPRIDMGDCTVPCFEFARTLRQSPVEIAVKLSEKMSGDDKITCVATGPYINITIHNDFLFRSLCMQYIQPYAKKNKTIMIEFLSPNTNKPLHLGHLRNGLLGMSIARILEFVGYDVVKANLINDRGVHICKSMVAWMKFADGKTPHTQNQKGDHFVGDYYVLFAQEAKNNPQLLEEAQDLLKKWEHGDQGVHALWQKMNTWVYDGFQQTYADIGFQFDVEYYESQIYKDGKRVILENIENNIFTKQSSGAVSFMLPQKEFGVNEDGTQKQVLVLRADGTSVYATQDIALAMKKSIDYKLDQSLYVVAEEQKYYFKTLFCIFEKMNFSWAKKCHHLSYGMVVLPDGKMKSREGNVVDCDDFVSTVTHIAYQQIKKQHGDKVSEKDAAYRAKNIALGSIKFSFLKTNPHNEIVFDSQADISFEGATGPYIQYAYTRAMSIMRHAHKNNIVIKSDSYDMLGNNYEERLIAQKLLFFSDAINKSALSYDPSIVANAVYEIAKAFHQFYNKHHVVTSDQELSQQRLMFVSAIAYTIKEGLALLGITVVEEM